jgi:hypothetical protein
MQDLRSEHVTLLLNRITGNGTIQKKKSKFDTESRRTNANNKESSSNKISVRQFITWVRTRQVSSNDNTVFIFILSTYSYIYIAIATCKIVCLWLMQPLHVQVACNSSSRIIRVSTAKHSSNHCRYMRVFAVSTACCYLLPYAVNLHAA